MDINIDSAFFNKVYLDNLINNKSKYVLVYGGSNSGKSYAIAQKILLRTVNSKYSRILVVRKVKNTLKNSVYQLFKDIIFYWNWGRLFNFNDTEKIITCVNGNKILFAGMDDSEKIKGIVGITSIWIEEATELFKKDFEELDRRLRDKYYSYKQIILSFNPMSSRHWLWHTFFVDGYYKENASFINTTYKDNLKFTDKNYINLLESYVGNAREVYTLGKWGKLENTVFKNIDIIDEFPDTDSFVYGVDFGYAHPLSIVKVYKKESDIYIDEIVYKVNVQIEDVCNNDITDKRHTYWCDSENPSDIAIMNSHGFTAIPVTKYSGSRMDSINYMLNNNIHITSRSTHVIKEFTLCERRKDKYGNLMEDIIKQNDHSIDATRYALMGNWMTNVAGNISILEV